jgi:ABC-type Fe3+-siderophore transport system permease subunit
VTYHNHFIYLLPIQISNFFPLNLFEFQYILTFNWLSLFTFLISFYCIFFFWCRRGPKPILLYLSILSIYHLLLISWFYFSNKLFFCFAENLKKKIRRWRTCTLWRTTPPHFLYIFIFFIIFLTTSYIKVKICKTDLIFWLYFIFCY